MISTPTIPSSAAFAFIVLVVCPESQSQPVAASKLADSAESRQAVLDRLEEIQAAATALRPEKIFDFVLENDQGALLQNGEFFRTRAAALQSTRQGFRGVREVGYRFDQQHVSFLSPAVALVTGEGSSFAVIDDGRRLTTRFVQSVVLKLVNGEWKVYHVHRSFPPPKSPSRRNEDE